MEDLYLAGKIEVEPSGETLWWLDENLQQHSRFVPRGESVPQFEYIQRRGLEVKVCGIGNYSITYSPAGSGG